MIVDPECSRIAPDKTRSCSSINSVASSLNANSDNGLMPPSHRRRDSTPNFEHMPSAPVNTTKILSEAIRRAEVACLMRDLEELS